MDAELTQYLIESGLKESPLQSIIQKVVTGGRMYPFPCLHPTREEISLAQLHTELGIMESQKIISKLSDGEGPEKYEREYKEIYPFLIGLYRQEFNKFHFLLGKFGVRG
jgi:hypothetical protein